jgi:hypothetical protein
MSESDIEEQMCTCGRYYARQHGWCSICIDNWIDDNFISSQIYDAGYKFGSELGLDLGIRHTIYRQPRDDYWILDDVDIPQYAYIDRKSYERGFDTGYTTSYNSVYQLHQPVIDQLEYIQKKYSFRFWVFAFYRNHSYFDTELLNLIDEFLPDIEKSSKIPQSNFTLV